MDGKSPGGPGGAARRPMLIKQENMMGSPDGYPGNMGVCSSGPKFVLSTFSLPLFSVCLPSTSLGFGLPTLSP